MRKVSACFAFVCVLLVQAAAASDIERLTGLLDGEFNNREQVWQQRQDEVLESKRFHWKWTQLEANTLNLALAEGQSTGEARWVFHFKDDERALRSEVYELGRDVLVCAYEWTRDGDGFLGLLAGGIACPGLLARQWQVDGQGLKVSQVQTSEEEAPTVLVARRVIQYEGWIAFARNTLDESAEADDFIFLSGLRAHDQGSMIPIVDDGEATGYAVELVQLTYQNTRVAVLKLGIVDQATGKTLSYAWANPGARRIGINLRWVQCGFTRL